MPGRVNIDVGSQRNYARIGEKLEVDLGFHRAHLAKLSKNRDILDDDKAVRMRAFTKLEKDHAGEIDLGGITRLPDGTLAIGGESSEFGNPTGEIGKQATAELIIKKYKAEKRVEILKW